jgi:hypothetical protein
MDYHAVVIWIVQVLANMATEVSSVNGQQANIMY